MDFLGFERQFIDHLAPVWRALPHRGRFLTDVSLVDHARSRGIEAEGVQANAIRRTSEPPRARLEDGPQAFVASIGDTKVARRLGYRRFAFIEHGAGQAYIGERALAGRRNASYSGGMDREDTELFLVPNEYSAGLWRTAYPAARVEVVGSPRLDDLPRRVMGGPAPTVAISFHWPAFVAPEAGTALGHYMRVLPELAKAFSVIGHSHPKGDWPARMERIYRKAGIEFVPDFDDVCRRADVYVCDNSSTLFEFASTNRPVVVLNSPQFRRNVSHGGRFWTWADIGIQVDQPADLIPAIREALQDPPQRQMDRAETLALVYAYRHGAAERAATALSSWAGTNQAVAA